MPTLVTYAPPRDAKLACTLVRRAGIECNVCDGEPELHEQVDAADAVLLAEEWLNDGLVRRLAARLVRQPPWSDLPIIVVARDGHHPGLLGAVAPLGNVTLLARPMAPDAFISAVSSALRARRRQDQVRELLSKQEEQSRRKDDFLAMLAHELRNPLAPVRHAAYLLQSGELKLGQLQQVGELVGRQVGHIARLIDQLLETTRVMLGKVELQMSDVDLAKVAASARDSVQALAHGRRVEIVARLENVEVCGDATRLRQVIDNLLDNAIKFSPADAAVELTVARRDGHAVISVVDQGDGIEPEFVEHLFKPFMQGGQKIERERGGLGLGLSLVRNLARMHGGEVTAESAGRGRGSRFTVHLPVLAVTQPTTLTSRVASSREDQPLRILLAEDNRDNAETMRLLLELAGHDVRVARTGLAAVEEARRELPDALICDIGLPGLSGYEVARTLRRDTRLRRIRFIALTGYGSADDRRNAFAAGFDAHMTKPVDPNALIAELAKAVRPEEVKE